MIKSINSETYQVERVDFPGIQSIIPRNDIFRFSDRNSLKDIEVS